MDIKNTHSKNKQLFDIFLPVIDETVSLEKTIRIIEKNNSKHIFKYLIVLSKSKTIKKSLKSAYKMKSQYKKKVRLLFQKKKFIGGALKEAINNSSSSHFILMASDLETNPNDVKKLIKNSLKYPKSIITANRWMRNDSFEGYNIVKLILNKIFQFSISLLFKVKFSDLTFAYRVYPKVYLKNMILKEKKHPILLETLLIPIKNKIDILEIPCKWKARTEGKSNNPFFRNFFYIITAFRILLTNKKKLTK